MAVSTLSSKTRCKYCGNPLTEDGFCSRPCKMGRLLRELFDLECKNYFEKLEAGKIKWSDVPEDHRKKTLELINAKGYILNDDGTISKAEIDES